MRSARVMALLVAAAGMVWSGCGPADSTDEARQEIALGPRDGLDLPGVDLERIRVGQTAPDFSLESYAGPVVTLSHFRGRKNVVLVFYRGYW